MRERCEKTAGQACDRLHHADSRFLAARFSINERKLLAISRSGRGNYTYSFARSARRWQPGRVVSGSFEQKWAHKKATSPPDAAGGTLLNPLFMQ